MTSHQPAKVLGTLWANLTSAEASGDVEAAYIRNNLRILVAGGDGTVTWVLGAIMELGLEPRPAVAVMPLGTGNDFSVNFGWGTKFEASWVKPAQLYRTLARYKTAEVRQVDVWGATITAPATDYFVEMPHSVRQDKQNPRQANAKFWNYFSVGLDAQAAYGFHHLRENHPRLAAGRVSNQMWYGIFSCSTGWFCGARPIAKSLKLRVKDTPNGPWKDIIVPPAVRAVVLLNLQSYGGGRDIWGLTDNTSLAEKGMQEPIYDDGLIEVLGFQSGWHTAVVMGQVSSKVHAQRLAQCCAVDLELVATGGRVKDDRGTVFMQLDGEPWPQQIPASFGNGKVGNEHVVEPLRVQVGNVGQSQVLVNGAETLGSKFSQKLTHRGLNLAPEPENGEMVTGAGAAMGN